MSIEVSACVGEHTARSGGQPARRARIRAAAEGSATVPAAAPVSAQAAKAPATPRRNAVPKILISSFLSCRCGGARPPNLSQRTASLRRVSSDLVEVFRGD